MGVSSEVYLQGSKVRYRSAMQPTGQQAAEADNAASQEQQQQHLSAEPSAMSPSASHDVGLALHLQRAALPGEHRKLLPAHRQPLVQV